MGRNEARATIEKIRVKRPRYTDEQVTFIRESYLLDNKSAPWINRQLPTQSSDNSIWKIATGHSYPDVPLSPRLLAAAAAKAAAENTSGPKPAEPARAADLLAEKEEDWD